MNELADFALRVVVALALGMAIGLERQFRQHPAGLRTNALVAMGAALFVVLGLLIDTPGNPGRVAANVVTGIGFLGGGVILREGLSVRGLATAATLWCSAAVGSLAGAGLLAHALVGAVGVLVILIGLRPVVQRIDAHMKTAVFVETVYRVRVVCPTSEAGVVRAIFARHVNDRPTMTLQGLATQDTAQLGLSAVVADVFSQERNDRYMNELVARLSAEPCVSAVSWERSH